MLWIIPVVLVVVLLLAAVAAWYQVSQRHFRTAVRPGQKYAVGAGDRYRTYTLPDLPMDPTEAQCLDPEYIDDQERLLVDAHQLLQAEGVEHWLVDSTLLGFVRQGCTMPTDDSLSLGVRWDRRGHLWSSEFARAADAAGLDVIFLRGATLHLATREGAAVRLRRRGTTTPVLHIGFHKELDGRWYLAEGWWGEDTSYSSTEIYEADWLFPVGKQTFEPSGLTLPVPAQPERVLHQVYGEQALTKMYARSPWISHHVPFEMFPFAWRKA